MQLDFVSWHSIHTTGQITYVWYWLRKCDHDHQCITLLSSDNIICVTHATTDTIIDHGFFNCIVFDHFSPASLQSCSCTQSVARHTIKWTKEIWVNWPSFVLLMTKMIITFRPNIWYSLINLVDWFRWNFLHILKLARKIQK